MSPAAPTPRSFPGEEARGRSRRHDHLDHAVRLLFDDAVHDGGAPHGHRRVDHREQDHGEEEAAAAILALALLRETDGAQVQLAHQRPHPLHVEALAGEAPADHTLLRRLLEELEVHHVAHVPAVVLRLRGDEGVGGKVEVAVERPFDDGLPRRLARLLHVARMGRRNQEPRLAVHPPVGERVLHGRAEGPRGVDDGHAQGLAALPFHQHPGDEHEPGHDHGAEERAHEEGPRADALEILAAGDDGHADHAAASPFAVTCSTKMSWRLGSTTSKRVSRRRAAASRRMACGSAPSAIRTST